jgi:ABC-type uncharacterized transport system substrate-binding protein
MKSLLRVLSLLAAVWAPAVLALPLVTVVQSYHADNAWDQRYLQGIQSKLNGVAELNYIALDTKRLPTSEHLQQAMLAFQKLQQQPPDLVILGDDAAVALMGQRLAWMNIPTVFLGVNAAPEPYFDGAKLPSNVTGVLERPRYQANLALIRELLPQQRRILVLMDQDRSAKIIHSDLLKLHDGELSVQMVATFEEWQKILRSAPEHFDAIIIATYQALVDQQQRHVEPAQVMAWSSANSKLPIFGFWDFQIGPEAALGGVVITGFEQGAVAGEMAKAQLHRYKAKMPLRYGSGVRLMLSRAQIERWKLAIPPALRHKISWQP